jgi:hypothetical protein
MNTGMRLCHIKSESGYMEDRGDYRRKVGCFLKIDEVDEEGRCILILNFLSLLAQLHLNRPGTIHETVLGKSSHNSHPKSSQYLILMPPIAQIAVSPLSRIHPLHMLRTVVVDPDRHVGLKRQPQHLLDRHLVILLPKKNSVHNSLESH